MIDVTTNCTSCEVFAKSPHGHALCKPGCSCSIPCPRVGTSSDAVGCAPAEIRSRKNTPKFIIRDSWLIFFFKIKTADFRFFEDISFYLWVFWIFLDMGGYFWIYPKSKKIYRFFNKISMDISGYLDISNQKYPKKLKKNWVFEFFLKKYPRI